MHLAELGAVALVKNDHDVPAEYFMPAVHADETVELLDGGDDDPRVGVFELLFQLGRRGVAVGRALLEFVVLLHRLVVEVRQSVPKGDVMGPEKAAVAQERVRLRRVPGEARAPDVEPPPQHVVDVSLSVVRAAERIRLGEPQLDSTPFADESTGHG